MYPGWLFFFCFWHILCLLCLSWSYLRGLYENPWNMPHLWCNIFGWTKSLYISNYTTASPLPHLPLLPVRESLCTSMPVWKAMSWRLFILKYADEMQISSHTDRAVFAVSSPLAPASLISKHDRSTSCQLSPLSPSYFVSLECCTRQKQEVLGV